MGLRPFILNEGSMQGESEVKQKLKKQLINSTGNRKMGVSKTASLYLNPSKGDGNTWMEY